MSFLYFFGKEKPRDNTDSLITDKVIMDLLISSQLMPDKNPLRLLHDWVSKSYQRNLSKLQIVRNSYVWKNNRWIKKRI